MAGIFSYDWDFGDGNVSSSPSPKNTYNTGWYTVELEVLTSLGYTSTITKEFYVKVGKSNQTNFNSTYLDAKTSLHYGWNNETSLGWSSNAGDSWVWAESKGAISNMLYGGDRYKLVWDIYTDKQYIINTGTGRITDEYTDQAVDGDDGVNVETIVTMPEFNGEKESFTISHIQTDVFYRSLFDYTALPSDFSVQVDLYDATGPTSVTVNRDVSVDRETVFSYQNRNTESSSYRQIGLTTNRGDYKLIGYESLFRIEDRARGASASSDTIEKQLTSPIVWYTRSNKGLAYDRISKQNYDGVITSIDGPDGVTNSAFINVQQDSIPFYGVTSPVQGGLMFWTTAVDVNTVLAGRALVEYAVKDNWKLVYSPDTMIEAELELASSNIGVFDLRAFDYTLTEKYVETYFDSFNNYLPRV